MASISLLIDVLQIDDLALLVLTLFASCQLRLALLATEQLTLATVAAASYQLCRAGWYQWASRAKPSLCLLLSNKCI